MQRLRRYRDSARWLLKDCEVASRLKAESEGSLPALHPFGAETGAYERREKRGKVVFN